jgi:hypothetical protein
LIPNNWDILLPINEEKQKHYWFWSEAANTGKTTFLLKMEETFRCSWYSRQESFQQIYTDSQFILIDEFTTSDGLKAT